MLCTFSTPKTILASFAISYSEFLDAFESFYSFTPIMYISVGRILLSTNPSNIGEVYMHDQGTYGSFYGTAAAQSYVNVLLNPETDLVKVFENIAYKSEIIYLNRIQPGETLFKFEFLNDFQQSGVVTLTPTDNVVRTFR